MCAPRATGEEVQCWDTVVSCPLRPLTCITQLQQYAAHIALPASCTLAAYGCCRFGLRQHYELTALIPALWHPVSALLVLLLLQVHTSLIAAFKASRKLSCRSSGNSSLQLELCVMSLRQAITTLAAEQQLPQEKQAAMAAKLSKAAAELLQESWQPAEDEAAEGDAQGKRGRQCSNLCDNVTGTLYTTRLRLVMLHNANLTLPFLFHFHAAALHMRVHCL